jgi:gas vesicle protein
MNEQHTQNRDYRLLMGLAIGGVVGAGLTMLLAPRTATEIGERAMGTARDLGNAASDRYREVRLRVSDAVDGIARKGQGMRDDVCDTVVRGAKDVEFAAQGVEHYATAAKTPKPV